MINITSSAIVVDGRAPLDIADPPAPAAPPTHEALAEALPDPVTAFAANFGLHPDPLGSKAGINARIRETILKKDGDPQAMFVLPEAANSPSKVDSPDHDLKYPVHWTNVSDQVKTVDDALAAANVAKGAVTERVVSAHSGGGMALNNLINADLNGGTRLQADRLELYDCVYQFQYKTADKVVDGKKVEGQVVRPAEWNTVERLEEWSSTPNGQAVKHVTLYSFNSDDKKGTRADVLEKAFPPDSNGHARFKKVDKTDEPGLDHYPTVGRHLGERLKP